MNAIILSALWGVLMMYTGFATSNKKTVSIVAVIGVLAVLVANWLEYAGLSFFNIDTKGMLVYNSFGFVFNLVCHLTLLMYFLLSSNEIEESSKSPSDHYALIFFITAGISIIAGFKSLLMLFIGIEIISIPLYVLAGSDKSNLKSNEAALKYFLMGSFSTGILLMGIAFLYGDAGTFYLEGINMGGAFLTPMKAIGLVLLMVSMAFKVSAAPFHFWTPDVYDGTPTVYTSFMATLVKSAGFFAFLKLFETAFGKVHSEWEVLLSVIIVLTIVVGNITAVFQQSVKRMLSYSSIAQAGFMLLGVYAMNLMAKQGIILYFAAYGIASIGLFAVLAKFKDHSIEGLNGFAKKHPLVAGSMLVSLLSLAGIPLTAGFFAKYYMLLSAMKYGNSLWLVIVAILGAAVSIYYYFRVIQAMYFKEEQGQSSEEVTFSSFFKVMMVVNAIILLVLGIHPDWLVMFL
ncbi:MAG: NADH-quinone oxidoreductase subunit N [Chitinophagaceae bacterium]|jgi:NADH-quinone oxidoreductase subunit N